MKDSFTEETHWEKAAKTRMGKYLTEIETRFVSETIEIDKCSLIIDIGAEAGRFSVFATGGNVEVMGIDIDSYGLKRLRAKDRHVNVVQADARHLPFVNGIFDVVFLIEVLDYIHELEACLGECGRTLKSGGSIVLSFGNRSSLKSWLRSIRGESYVHSYREVTEALKRSELKIARKLGYNWLLFGRTSENQLIPLLAKAESLLKLRKLPSVSPWVMMHVLKPE
jgi:SAM-dependent methyltransferase